MNMRQISSVIILAVIKAHGGLALTFNRSPLLLPGRSCHTSCLSMTLRIPDDNDTEPEQQGVPKRRVLFRRNSTSRGKRARIIRSVQETPPVAAFSAHSLESYPLLPEDDLSPLVQTVVRAVDMRKAENIVVLKVSQITSLTEFIIICTGNSRPQNQAIAGAVQQEVRENFSEKFKVRGNGAPEGSAESGWIILDYGDIMVHVMTPRSRLYFDIEGKWKGKGAAYVDITSWLTLDPTSSFPAARQMDEASNDPFWS